MRKKHENELTLSNEKRKTLQGKIEFHIHENLEIEIGNLQADMLIDFIEKEVGAFFYNKGIEDAIKYMTEKSEDLYLLMKDER